MLNCPDYSNCVQKQCSLLTATIWCKKSKLKSQPLVLAKATAISTNLPNPVNFARARLSLPKRDKILKNASPHNNESAFGSSRCRSLATVALKTCESCHGEAFFSVGGSGTARGVKRNTKRPPAMPKSCFNKHICFLVSCCTNFTADLKKTKRKRTKKSFWQCNLCDKYSPVHWRSNEHLMSEVSSESDKWTTSKRLKGNISLLSSNQKTLVVVSSWVS